jgi:hypothetical protein
METIRICIGTEPKMRIPEKVLEYTIRKYTTGPVEIHKMIGGHWENSIGGHTGFSFRRWMIPEYFDFEGHAIYMDADQIVFDDVRLLWDMKEKFPAGPGNGLWAAYKGRRALVSVLLIDCSDCRYWAQVPEKVKSGEWSRGHVMQGKWIKPRPIDVGYEWNHIDHYVPGETKLLHYSDLKRQPWFQPAHPLSSVWITCLREAISEGAVLKEDIEWARGIYRKKEGLHPKYDEFLKGVGV